MSAITLGYPVVMKMLFRIAAIMIPTTIVLALFQNFISRRQPTGDHYEIYNPGGRLKESQINALNSGDNKVRLDLSESFEAETQVDLEFIDSTDGRPREIILKTNNGKVIGHAFSPESICPPEDFLKDNSKEDPVPIEIGTGYLLRQPHGEKFLYLLYSGYDGTELENGQNFQLKQLSFLIIKPDQGLTLGDFLQDLCGEPKFAQNPD